MRNLATLAFALFVVPTFTYAQSSDPQVYGNGTVFLYYESVEIYGNRWDGEYVGRSAEGASIKITGEGKTVSFSGEYIVACGARPESWSSEEGFWVGATNGSDKIKSADISKIVPHEVVVTARLAFCELPLVRSYFESANDYERRDFQGQLKLRGMYEGKVDGAWGPGTATGALSVLSYYSEVGMGMPLMNIADARLFVQDIASNGVMFD